MHQSMPGRRAVVAALIGLLASATDSAGETNEQPQTNTRRRRPRQQPTGQQAPSDATQRQAPSPSRGNAAPGNQVLQNDDGAICSNWDFRAPGPRGARSC